MQATCHIYGQLSQAGDRLEGELAHLFSLGLVCDCEMPLARLPEHREALCELQGRGGLIAPTIYPPDLDASLQDTNWWKLPAETCEDLLKQARDQYEAAGLGKLEAINTYTPGNGLVAACRALGIGHILGFCAPIVIEDGGWEIAHYGSPLSPYFVSDEDFRKPEDPRDRADAVLMASMELRNPLVCLNHWSEGPWCPLNAQAADRWLEPSADPLPFLMIAEDWIRQAELDECPRFFHLNLQYFFAGRCFDHNRRALEWVAEQCAAGRLRTTGLKAWGQTLRKNSGFLRQSTLWSGEMPGYHAGHRPGFMPDVLVDENLHRQAIWIRPQALPQRWYDYDSRWDFPAFEPDGSAPASRPGGSWSVRWELAVEEPGLRRGRFLLEGAGTATPPPLAVWDAFEDCAGPFSIEVPAACFAKVVPHPAGVGAVVLLETAETRREIPATLRFSARTAPCRARRWGDLLEARTFSYRGRPFTTIAAQTPEAFRVSLLRQNSAENAIRIESLCGPSYRQQLWNGEALELAFDATRLACWHRLWDITAGEIEIAGTAAVEADLRARTERLLQSLSLETRLPHPGYQLFGNIRDASRWDREVGQAAGRREIAAMNDWFRAHRAEAGVIVIEVHAGAALPRGSITKVLGHEFDTVRCTSGYGFQELCVDYPQSWEWGVAAWVQWRWLKVRLGGLQNKNATHTLHLHAFDPEERNLCQRIHFIHPENRAMPQLCVEPCWEVPPGLQARRDPAALCSIPIPDICHDWPAIDVWINPLERVKMDDWIAEGGAPGMLSHLWVTKTPG